MLCYNLDMAVSREQFRGTGIEVYVNKTIATMVPEWRAPVKVRPDCFGFSTRELMYSSASACTIAALQEENGRWGLFHGAFRRNGQMREPVYTKEDIAQTETLEKFLNAWNITRTSSTVAAYLFATSSSVDEDTTDRERELEKQARRRQEAIELVKEKTNLPDDRLFIRWNNYIEGETDVIVDPVNRIIRMSLDYCDDEFLVIP